MQAKKDPTDTVLLVDDEPALRMILARNLVRNGHVVTEASNGREAIKILDQGGIDLVLTDVQMPDGTGIDILAWMREKQVKLPVVLMSGYTDLSIEDAKLNGAAALFSKPLDSGALLKKIDELISFHRFLNRKQ